MPKEPEVNPLMEKLLGGEAGAGINRQRLGPGITCKVKIQNPAGMFEPDPQPN